MREIKFRAWDKEYKKMMEWGKQLKGLTQNGIKTVMSYNSESGWSDCYNLKDIDLMQFTGLHDKNGVEIYEGDIVKIKHENGYQTFEEEVEVAWDEHGFSPMNWQYECDGCSIYCEILEIEVIGNIHEVEEDET